ncbi:MULTISPECIES: endonuclease III [Syntrophotalea]|uniref:Endonuclease III n=1 Tax=Syntrophotalea acetylenica TaxID=29542 RepID=A0A1L3GFI8_SYNAC|nr:endonuclease III [Syntrophotalea acetylenica]APG24722.1 endonuclease III [Syntrophotalea acetylenica]APG42777.1 endonuclease III [Syntrophotalea acetylenica]MDY0261728.1 endonuclease III [Syntrophotalea acetylenica]
MSRTKQRMDAMMGILDVLEDLYPEARCALDFANPWQLLVATILSAQCTDRQVNKVTKNLFSLYPGPRQLAAADPEEVEAVIRSTGFFRNKAKNLIACAAQVVNQCNGQVPRRMEELVTLPGVGRKTANVVLGNAFDIPGLAVDTHVKRLVRRLGWSRRSDPEGIESELCQILPPSCWTKTSHLLIHHGRRLCKAQRPLCDQCPLQADCPRIGLPDIHIRK